MMECCQNKYEVGKEDEDEADALQKERLKIEKLEREQPVREYWGHQIEFLLSLIGYAVGLGNIWRFPYLCMRNGGGAFLIPYFTFMLLAGTPLFFLEASLGQFSSLSTLAVWKVCPLFLGLGWSMIILSGIYSLYSNIIVGWILYYLGMSFTSWELPWGRCDNSWNTPNCRVRGGQETVCNMTTISDNETIINCTNITAMNLTTANITGRLMSPAEEFWQYSVLEMSPGIEHLGGLRWQLVLCQFSAWFLIFICLIKGIKSSGKVVYVTATVPYFFFVALLIRGLTLPGAYEGVSYYLSPKWEKLASFKIWAEACLQVFFSLGPGWGGIITMSSYNRFHHNCLRDAVMIPLITGGTSFMAGFVVFSVIGHLAQDISLPIEDAVTQGPGLAFVAYPEALARLPGAPVWSVCFFLMLLTVGLDTQFVTFETLTSGFVDQFPRLRPRKTLFSTIMVVSAFLVSLLFTSRAGIYHFQIWDWYSAAYGLVLIAILECVIISFVYGLDRFFDDLHLMLGKRPSVVWKISWYALCPLFLMVCFFFALIEQVPPTYGDYKYPYWAIVMGWFLASVSVLPIPIMMVKKLYSTDGSFIKRMKTSVRPSSSWGPALAEDRAQYKYNCDSLENGSAINEKMLSVDEREDISMVKVPLTDICGTSCMPDDGQSTKP